MYIVSTCTCTCTCLYNYVVHKQVLFLACNYKMIMSSNMFMYNDDVIANNDV